MKKDIGKRLEYYIIYTILFAGVSALLFSFFYLNNITFINKVNDGLIQHYKALIYYSDYLKRILHNIFVEHTFVIPHWDFSIGEGADILETLHMYAIGDPLSVFSVFFNKSNIYIYYDLSIIIRLYLAGIVFSELCFYTGNENKYSILASSFVYVFCYWSLLNVNEHIYFLNPMIYLPLIILGVEKLLKEDKSVLLSIAVFISAISNFYFFYMLVLLTVIYVAVRLVFKHGTDIRSMISDVIRIFIASLLGTLMASVVLFPVAYTFINNSRASVDGWCGLLYPRFYYERLFTIFVSNDSSYDLCMGFASPTVLALCLLLKDRSRKGRMLLALNIIALMIIALPIAGKVMNGMAYPINRWSFGIALLVAYSFMYEWQEIDSNRRYLLISMFVVFVGSMVSGWSRQLRVFIPIGICIVFFVAAQLKLKDNIKNWIKIALVILNILFIATYDYSDIFDGRAQKAATVEEAVNEVMHSEAADLKQYLNNDSLERYAGNNLRMNGGMLEGLYSTDFYWSLSNGHVLNYREKMGLNDFASYYYRGYDSRAALNSLANVSAYIGYDLIPYGFERQDGIEGYGLSRNRYALPFGYTYAESISYERWDKLNQIEKQEALLEYIVINDGADDKSLSYDLYTDYQLSGDENILLEDKKIIVNEEKAELHININNETAGEYCLSINGLDFEDTYGYIEGNRNWPRIKLISGDIERNIHHFTDKYQFYSGRHDYTVSYGYLQEGMQEITLIFYYPGIYTFDDMFVTCNKFEGYSEKIDRLKQDHLEQLNIYDNGLSGTISLDQDKYLLLSIPYSKGWTAYVDEQKTELIRANECYMALKLESGNHQIELKYETPYLTMGTIISALSLVAFIVMRLKRKTE